MTDIISIQISGHLTRDAEKTETGCTKFTTASNYWDKRSNSEQTLFFSCFYFGKQNILNYLTKGTQVFLVGRMVQNSFIAQDGTQKTSLSIFVDDLKFRVLPKTEAGAQTKTQNNGGYQTQSTAATYTQKDFGDDIPF